MAKRYLGGGVSFEQKDVYQEFSEDSGGGGSSTLSGLTDVDISNPTDGQMLVYNAESGKWENGEGGGGSGGVRVIDGVYSEKDYEISTTITAAEMLAAYLAGEVVIHWVESQAGPGRGTVDVNMYALLYSAESAGELGAMFYAIGRSDLRASLTPLTNTVTFIIGS